MPIEALAQGPGHDPKLPLQYFQFTKRTPMRYNPATDRALSIDEIAAQCKAAILKSERQHVEQVADRIYDEVLSFYRWEDDVLIAA
jgi:hypothetical protein